MIKKYIKMIVDNGNPQDMECLSDMLSDIIYLIKDGHYDTYKKYKNKLEGMAYNYKINEELAKEIVEDMKPLGEHWDMQTIKNAIGNDMHRLEDMYVVMNSLANDYSQIISLEDTETYINMAHAWIDDVDAKKNKVWKYFVED